MNDLILRYYEAELRYLREAGHEFALAHPDRAAALNLDRIGDRDPYVERLFEGFAFLSGRIRQKLDDDFPELTEGLVSLLWPHYMRLIPSLTVLELMPALSSLQHNEIVPQGLEVRSNPITIGQDRIRCPYRTTQPVELLPLSLVQAGHGLRPDGKAVINFRFQLEPQANLEALDISSLRFYIHADRPIAFTLHYYLTHHVDSISWRFQGDDPAAGRRALPGAVFKPIGVKAEERLWPKAENAFGGYQLLLEYFCFREKFLFTDLRGLSAAAIPRGARSFDVEVLLKKSYPDDMPFAEKNIRLYCSPAINLFDLEAEPIRVDHQTTEYRVIPMLHHGRNVETHSVESVDAFDHATGERGEYVPFASFKHRGGMIRHQKPERYFHARVRRGASGLFETWLVLGGQAWDSLEKLPEETLSLKVTGTNGMLPRKALRESQITELMAGMPNIRSVRNLTAPTLPYYPPMEDRFHWRVLSHLAPNYLSLMDAEMLRGTLALYDWTGCEMNRRILEGIMRVSHRAVIKIEKGCARRGIAIEVTLDSHRFSGEGELYLFGDLLNRFFAAYADMNIFTQLTVISMPKGEAIKWKPEKTEASRL